MDLEKHVRILLDSYAYHYGPDLIDRENDEVDALYQAPFVVVSHDTQSDPVFNYGNLAAQKLFDMDWNAFTQLPSRYSAEPLEREERAVFKKEVTESGYSNSYRGIRISATGKRFYIESARVWNLHDASGNPCGQAATFSTWTYL